MHEPKHIAEVLTQTKEAIEKEDVLKLKELSNQTIHAASIEKDTDSIAIATIVYSLGKIIERRYNKEFKSCRDFCKKVSDLLTQAIDSVRKENDKKFSSTISKMTKLIENISGEFKKYIDEVLQKAKINKASKIYEHGISMEKTAKLLGITQWDLASYSGQKTEVSDSSFNKTVDEKTRIKYVEDFFK